MNKLLKVSVLSFFVLGSLFVTNSVFAARGVQADAVFPDGNSYVPQVIINSLNANPSTIAPRDSSYLTWSTVPSDAFCNIGKFEASVPYIVYPTSTTTYQIDCSHPGYISASASVTVIVQAPNTYTLTINKNGSGHGDVFYSPEYLSNGEFCGDVCSKTFAEGAIVGTIVMPAPGSIFSGWSGAGCSGIEYCNVIMDSNKTLTATFSTGSYFTATNTNVNLGDSQRLDWDASPSGVTSCRLNGGIYSYQLIPVTGSRIVTPDATTTYSLTCDNPSTGAGYNGSVTITVNTRGNISASDCQITAGNSSCTSNINWGVFNTEDGMTSSVATTIPPALPP